VLGFRKFFDEKSLMLIRKNSNAVSEKKIVAGEKAI
jgi:hypothetical protein